MFSIKFDTKQSEEVVLKKTKNTCIGKKKKSNIRFENKKIKGIIMKAYVKHE